MTTIAIIGAGLGGLSAAVALASRGHRVTLFEADEHTGGKVGVARVDGVEFDTGPSLLTLPGVLDELFELAGTSLRDELELVRCERAFRYLWPDGTELDIHHEPEATAASIRRTLGPDAAEQFSEFLDYSQGIWEAAAPHFVFGEAPSVSTIAGLGVRSMAELMAIDPMRTMAGGIAKRVDDPYLCDVLFRYATYNGSSPFEAPAALNCIAWVELGLGGFGVRGGMYEVVRALERVGRRLGLEVRLETPVRRIEVNREGVSAVETDAGRHGCDAIVVNADVAHLLDDLLDGVELSGLSGGATPSMSAWTGLLRARCRPSRERPAHTVLFPEDYGEEFVDIFERDRPPAEPTVYLCAQQKAHRRRGWEDHEPLFTMVNAPAEPVGGRRPPQVFDALARRALERVCGAGLVEADDSLVWQRTPADLASRFPATRGSIYGAASNSRWAAFRRPANRVDELSGLYLASGSAHPGGGVPLCIQSGKTAARLLHDDFGG